jgi:two-component system, response regulator PdtaR
MTPRPEHDNAVPLSGLRIVIVEDDFSVACSLEWLLESLGAEVVGKSGNLASALELFERQHFDVAILDIDLKGTSVAPAAERVHGQGRHFVFLTGYGDLGMLPTALRSHARIGKPVNPDELVSAILGQG